MKAKVGLPLGPQDGNAVNVAVQRPTVNLKEAENAGEQAVAASRHSAQPDVRFSKHGKFPASNGSGLHGLFD